MSDDLRATVFRKSPTFRTDCEKLSSPTEQLIRRLREGWLHPKYLTQFYANKM